MGKATKNELYVHVQRFVREVYSEQLRKAGFVSYRNEDIHWFRLVNQEVIQMIYFVTDYVGFPVMLEIGYGCHPLFIPPLLQKSPYMNPMPGNEQMYQLIPEINPGSMPHGVQRAQVHSVHNKIYRVPDVLVHCPYNDQTSMKILTNVLSVLDPIDTPAACYEMHKHWRNSQIENGLWLTMTPYFVDEVLYWDDKSLYPFCIEYLNGRIAWLNDAQQAGKLICKADQEELLRLHALQDVFHNEKRQSHVQVLCNRASENLIKLRKYFSLDTAL